MQEAQLHLENCFITLTYATEKLPKDGASWRRDFQLFLKRFRRHQDLTIIPWRARQRKISYFACGEFGGLSYRPHFHSLIFGFDFADKRYWKTGKSGSLLYTSRLLSELWTDPRDGKSLGFSSVGALTYESAAYTAQYVMKKQTNARKARDEYPKHIDPETGEITWLGPEFMMCSLRPGIGKEWFDRFGEDCFPSDFVVVSGRKMRVPRYYDRLMGELAPSYMEELKTARKARINLAEQHRDRLRVKAKILESRLKLYGRELDDDHPGV